MKLPVLKLDLWIDTPSGHPIDLMENLGIDYEHRTPDSLGSCWWFWLPSNLPEELPSWLSVVKLDPMDRIGRGLSEEMALELINLGERYVETME